ncbi:MAG: hypothetical protein IPN86_24150 [Saprospiraceae bacterium]|nr:hypothetical protein [Saprospiraceae bacterium]
MGIIYYWSKYCGIIEKPFKIADTFPDFKDSLIVCTLQEFPLLVNKRIINNMGGRLYFQTVYRINEPGIYSYYLNK